jgi:rfaE bifunctional protein kinase chain/domain
LARGQQILRIDHEDIAPLSVAETDKILTYIEECWPEQRLIIISDYNKGVINKRLIEGIIKIKHSYKNTVSILVDPKPENLSFYQNVDLLTPNTKEAGEGTGLPVRNKEEILKAGLVIRKKSHCKSLLVTLGSDGMALFQDKKIIHIPTLAKQVYDVTGAGDTVIGTLGLSLAAGLSVLDSCILANYAAGIVVGKSGSATTNQQEMKTALQTFSKPKLEEWYHS